MKKQISTILAVMVLVSGCSWMPSMSSLNPFSDNSAPAGEAVQAQVRPGVNPFLWQAALSKLSFMPLTSADSQGGVIVTDWASMDGSQNEQFKITVSILSRHLRADCVKVVVFKRVKAGSGWVNDQPDPRVAAEIEKAILTQARKLYQRDLAARED